MFFNSLVVPHTPPSFVKFRSSAAGVMIGCGTSVPSSDQVPELRKARGPKAGTDATADPVSWHDGATTGVPSRAYPTLDLRPPMGRAGGFPPRFPGTA